MSGRRVKLVSFYSRITPKGRGIGLLWRELQDADTGETVHRQGRGGCNWLHKHAEKQGWVVVRPEGKP